MPTCEIEVQSVRLVVLKNSRSPTTSWLGSTGLVAWYWSAATRGRAVYPAWRYDQRTRPEQSNVIGPSVPHTYRLPSLLSAARTAARAIGFGESPLELLPGLNCPASRRSLAICAASASATALVLRALRAATAAARRSCEPGGRPPRPIRPCPGARPGRQAAGA